MLKSATAGFRQGNYTYPPLSQGLKLFHLHSSQRVNQAYLLWRNKKLLNKTQTYIYRELSFDPLRAELCLLYLGLSSQIHAPWGRNLLE